MPDAARFCSHATWARISGYRSFPFSITTFDPRLYWSIAYILCKVPFPAFRSLHITIDSPSRNHIGARVLRSPYSGCFDAQTFRRAFRLFRARRPLFALSLDFFELSGCRARPWSVGNKGLVERWHEKPRLVHSQCGQPEQLADSGQRNAAYRRADVTGVIANQLAEFIIDPASRLSRRPVVLLDTIM